MANVLGCDTCQLFVKRHGYNVSDYVGIIRQGVSVLFFEHPGFAGGNILLNGVLDAHSLQELTKNITMTTGYTNNGS